MKYRNFPICPVVLIDERDEIAPVYPMSLSAVRHVFEELAQTVPPEDLTFAIVTIESGHIYRLPEEGIALGRLATYQREGFEARGLRWCPDHGVQRIGPAPETT